MSEAYSPEIQEIIDRTNREWEAVTGEARLWRWFGLSRASFCVMPRVYMHAMPAAWQEAMARLLEQYDDAVTHDDALPFDGCRVQATKGGKIVKSPDWLLNYRRPDAIIGEIVRPQEDDIKAVIPANGEK